MRREFECPHCGYTIDGVLGWFLCPRCRGELPRREADLAARVERGGKEDSLGAFMDDLHRPQHVPELASIGPLKDGRPSVAWRRWRLRLAGFGIAAVLCVGMWLLLDLDRDGLPTITEMRIGTSPVIGDSDGDTLADGWEHERGMAPTKRDSDRDGLRDDAEILGRSNPREPDSDGDGLPDAAEVGDGDCDGDGYPAPADADDDGDARLDAAEEPALRCTRDADADGVPDGYEGNVGCMKRPDCDGDGLGDGLENGTAYSALDPDTFDLGLPDAIPWAFEREGQAPAPDRDGDGIPDGWEPGRGLIRWGALQPATGRRDLLIEYLRVEGPDSGRFSDLSFAPAYDAVARFFGEGGIHVSHVETVVELGSEQRAPLVPDAGDAYYAAILAEARYSANPYVTTVVMNPQHDQSQSLHAGAASLRGMLAAIDYGAHVEVLFEREDGPEFTLYPVLESVAIGGRQQNIEEAGFDDGGRTADGRVALRVEDDGYWLAWRPNWFRTDPEFLYDDGSVATSDRVEARVIQDELAHTIAHELGHTLGLCHAHEQECWEDYPEEEQARRNDSTMSYGSPAAALHFLDNEWDTARTYLACAPQAPLARLAEGGTAAQVRAAKYDASGADARDCGDYVAIQRNILPHTTPSVYKVPEGEEKGKRGGHSPAGHALFTLLAGLFCIGGAIGYQKAWENLTW